MVKIISYAHTLTYGNTAKTHEHNTKWKKQVSGGLLNLHLRKSSQLCKTIQCIVWRCKYMW